MIVSTLTAESPSFHYPSMQRFLAVSFVVHVLLLLGMLVTQSPSVLPKKEAQVQVKLKVPPSAPVPKTVASPKTLVVEEKVVPPTPPVALKPAPVPAAARSLALAPQMLASKLAGKETAAPKKVEMASPPRPVEKTAPKPKPNLKPKAEPASLPEKESKPADTKRTSNINVVQKETKGLFVAPEADKQSIPEEEQMLSPSQKHLNEVAERFTEENFKLILKKWQKPGPFNQFYEGVMRIKCSPGGMITGVTLLKSSGNDALDRSMLEAVTRTRFMKMPNDVIVPNSYFTSVQLTFDSTM